jgi:AbrB family looped-hinge helix DNA binding protein
MRTTIDSAGRVVIPKPLRQELGIEPGSELELSAVNGHLEIVVPSAVRLEEGPHGLRFITDDAPPLTADDVRALQQRDRR